MSSSSNDSSSRCKNKMESEVMGSKLIRCTYSLLMRGSHFICNVYFLNFRFPSCNCSPIEMTIHYSQMHDSEEAFWG